MKSLYDEFAERPEVQPYMPPKLHKGRTLSKRYFWDVVGTVYPDEVEAIIRHANEQRNSVEAEDNKNQAILVSEEMQGLLFKYPWVSK